MIPGAPVVNHLYHGASVPIKEQKAVNVSKDSVTSSKKAIGISIA